MLIAEVANAETKDREPIAIVGLGCRLPGGIDSPALFWSLLRDERDVITQVPSSRWDLEQFFHPDPRHPLTQHVRKGGFIDDIDLFDPGFFGLTPREATCMDPQQRMLLEVAWRAFEDAGMTLEEVKASETGVFVGISTSDYRSLLDASIQGYRTPDNEPFILPGNAGSIAANRISYFFDFKGPSLAVDTACSSSLVAVHLACESLWRSESRLALAGGVQVILHPAVQSSFCKAGLLASDGRCKSFDASADGYVRSEGAGLVLLKPLVDAIRDGDSIYALIHGTAVNSDGRSNGMASPNARAQMACVRTAYANAGISPCSTQYVEAHGTGTKQGDPIELRALGTVLGEGRDDENPCRIGSVKTNVGHSETAAGITGLIKAALCIAHRQLPASLHLNRPNPSIDFTSLKLQVQTSLEPFPRIDQPLVVGVSSFGFGGTNAHIVLTDALLPAAPSRFGKQLPLQLITLSARTPSALAIIASDLTELIETQSGLQLSDLAASINQTRSSFRERAVCLASDTDQFLHQLKAIASDVTALKAANPTGLCRSKASRRPGKLAWLFTGQGSLYSGMCEDLQEHPVFRQALERVAGLLDPLLPQPLNEVLAIGDMLESLSTPMLHRTGLAQPALFALGYALSELWQSWGVTPDVLMGHSVGEVLAAHLAGVFSLEDACRLVAARGRLMQDLPGDGAMAAMFCSPERLAPILLRHPLVSIAAFNAPTNTVVSGPAAALQEVLNEAESHRIEARPLDVSHAFHTKAMAAMLPDFECELRAIRFLPPRLPLVSNLTGELAGAEIANPDYWCDQVLSPVHFAQGVNTLVAQGAQLFLEIGPRPTLLSNARQCVPDSMGGFWPSLVPGKNNWETILNSLGGLWRAGYAVEWKGFHRPFPHRKVKLPGYPFERQRYWWSCEQDINMPSSLWLEHLGVASKSNDEAVSTTPQTQSALPEQLHRFDMPGALQVFQTYLRSDHGDLADHRIRDLPVFPAAGFIAAALSMQQEAGTTLALGSLRLEQPLRFPTPNATTVPRQLLQLHCTDTDITFHSRTEVVDATAEDVLSWQCHGRVELTPSTLQVPMELLAIPPRASDLELVAFYDTLSQVGLNYGARYRCLRRLQVNGTQAWAELERPAGGSDRCLIDACFQAVAGLLDQEAREGQLLLPVGLEAIWLAALPLPERLHCQVQLKTSEEPAFVIADLVLHDGATTLGWIRGFRLRRLPRLALEWLFPHQDPSRAAIHHAGNQLLQTNWQPAAATTTLATSPQPIRIGWADAIPTGPEPVLLWPDLEQPGLTVEAVAAQLLHWGQSLAAAPPRSVFLVVEGEGPLAGAAAAFARSAALEQAQFGWTILHLTKGEAPGAADWTDLIALSAQEPVLAWRGSQAWVQRLEPLEETPFRLESAALGSLDSLKMVDLQRRSPGPGEIELAVESTGLNFRDVLNALGLLASYSNQLGIDANARMPFGGECVGRVVAVGPGVDPALVGERMLAALSVGSLASHVVCRASLSVPWPNELDRLLGASISTAFLTAIYGLQTLAELKPGETVLIHAAAGGVGQAALQVAHRLGARVLATASPAKHATLLEQGVGAVFDSRSLHFADQVKAATGGRGVDVVLNSLKGEWVEASFQALAEGGRFIELGKIEIWSRLEAAERRPDARYLPFDLLEVAAADPSLVRGLLQELVADVVAGRFSPLPMQVFPVARTEEAFRLMAQGRHVGKVVIDLGQRPSPWSLAPDALTVVSGAFGAIGRQLCHWLVKRGARSLLLIGRHSDPKLLDDLERQGASCKAISLDLACTQTSDNAAFLKLVEAMRLQPLGGVFHAAGCLDDGLIESQTAERQAAVIGPKWTGWLCLQAAWQQAERSPEFAVLFSSMASLLGSPGQTSYSAANGALDATALQQPRVLSVQWGPWAGEGMAAGLERRFSALGVGLLQADQAFNALSLLLERGRAGSVAVLNNDWSRLSAKLGARQAAFLEGLRDIAELEEHSAQGEALRRQLSESDQGQQLLVVVELLQERLATVMGLSDSNTLDPGDSLFHIGLDSLMAVELAAGINRDLGVNLELESLAGDPTIEVLARLLLDALLAEQEGQRNELDLGSEARLPSYWQCTPGTASHTPNPDDPVLLTGASGFLGAYLLAGQLERWPTREVRCVVRAADSTAGLDRIRNNLSRYGVWQEHWAERVRAVPGDLAQPKFGLNEDAFAELAAGLGGILHNGAQLSQMASYSQLEATNVGGTQTVLDLAVHPATGQPVPVHLISSVAVFEANAYRNQEILESEDVAEWRGIHLGYSQTKWVSEGRVLAAGALGLPVTVYRPPLIGGHSKTGAWHQDDLLQRLLAGCLELGMAPDLAWELDLVPVDYVADAVTALAWSADAVGKKFHLQHPKPMMLTELLGKLIVHGTPLRVVSMERWLEAIVAKPSNPLHPLRAFFVRRWGDEQLTYPELNEAGRRSRPSCKTTVEILKTHGVECPDFDALQGPYARSLLSNLSAMP